MISTTLNIKFLGLTELILDQSLVSLHGMPGYCMFSNCRNVHGGGAAIYVSTEYELSAVTYLTISDLY